MKLQHSSSHHGEKEPPNNITCAGILIKSLCLGNLTGKDTINEINKGNHNCEGHKGTIIIALSTVSVFILDRILGIIVNGGK
jgi:hypothetical protein